MSIYQVHWFDHNGNKKTIFQSPIDLEYVKTVNAVGTLVMTFPRAFYQYEDFSVGDMFEIWREKGGVLELQNETAYFLQNWEFWTDSDGAEYIRLIAFDAIWLLDTAIVMAYANSTEAKKTDAPDDMMKAIVREQLGTTAGTGREKLDCAPDLSAGGADVSKDFGWRNVLDVMNELCGLAKEVNGIWLGFDVVRTAAGTFEFRTYTERRGQDHGRNSGDPRFVGKQYGNFSEATFGTYHADERNFIVVGGQGEFELREIVYRWNYDRWHASKWNRREYFMDSRDDDDSSFLESDGDVALEEFKPKQILTGTLHDTPGMQYGVHYGFGDILSVEAFGYHVDCHVKAVRVRVDQDGGEQLDIKLEGEL